MENRSCMLLGELLLEISNNATLYKVLSKTIDLTTLVAKIVSETNLYATQTGRNFTSKHF